MIGNVDELSVVFLEPQRWWKLELDDQGHIRAASLWNQWRHWFCSWVGNDQYAAALKGRIREIVAKLPEIRSPEQEIALEKIARLTHSSLSWLYGALPNLPKPPVPTVVSRGQLESSIHPYEDGGRYYNRQGEPIWRQFFTTVGLLFPGTFDKATDENLKVWHRSDWHACPRSIEPKITWLGHASLLIQANGFNLIFDPTFSFVGPCFLRHTEPPIPFEKLPLIDVVGISHNHGDHFDQKRLEKLAPMQPIAFVPHRLDPWFQEKGFESVDGAKWWQSVTLEREGHQITLTALPARHGSQTTLTDLNRSLWMGVLIEFDGKKIYFAGDTAYDVEMFEEIKRHFGAIDIACLPIAPEKELDVHLDHAQALDALELLGAKYMIPIHHGAYRMGAEKIEDPINIFMAAAARRNLLPRIINLQLGQTCDVLRHVEEALEEQKAIAN